MPRDKTESHIRIVEAAKKEFMEFGYADASLRRIAANADIQVSGLYKHFSNKEEMFASLVEPALEEFYKMYYEIEKIYVDGIEDSGENFVWENGSDTVREMNFIYDHLEEFKLLILRSQGTKYEDFIHKIAKLEEKETLAFMKMIEDKGGKVNHIDATELHLLMTSYIESVFQPVVHGLSRKKAIHYAETLEKFYEPAWKSLFGI